MKFIVRYFIFLFLFSRVVQVGITDNCAVLRVGITALMAVVQVGTTA